MPKSRSGSIRQGIGGLKKRLVDVLAIGNRLLKIKPLQTAEASAQAIEDIETLIARLEVAITSLKEKDKMWLEQIGEIEEDGDLTSEEAIYAETASSEETGYLNIIEDSQECVQLLRLKLSRLQRADTKTRKPPVDLDTSTSSTRSTSGKQSKTAKLPKLTLPTFDGDQLQWPQFWAIFRTNIHDTDLDGIEKLSYLRAQLRGIALNAIEGLVMDDNSYETAIAILKDRFERKPEQIIGNLYSNLKRIPVSGSSVAEMQKTYDACEKIFRQLKTVGEDIDKNRSLVLDVFSKYPNHIIKEISRRKNVGNYSTVSEAHQAISQFIEESESLYGMLDDIEPFASRGASNRQEKSNKRFPPSYQTGSSSSGYSKPSYQYSPKPPENNWNRYSDETAKSSTLNAVEHSGSPSVQPQNPCCFCGGNHFNAECDRYRNLQLRLKQLEVQHRCTRCVSDTHVVANCRTRSERLRCFHCRTVGNHPTSLCPQKFGSPTFVKPKTSANFAGENRYNRQFGKAKGHEPERKRVVVENSSTSSTSCAMGVDESAVLSTATVVVTNPSSGRQKLVRVIFDSGSHRTYVKKSLADELHLDLESRESLQVAIFGSEKTLSVPSNLVKFEISLRNGGSTGVIGHTTPLITKCSVAPGKLPQSTQALIDSMQYAMADDYSVGCGQPDILIGTDYFWQFITGAPMPTTAGVFLIPSTVGLLLGGKYQGDENVRNEGPTLICLTERTCLTSIDSSLADISTESKTKQPYPDVDEFWSLERIGISDDPKENDDEIALQQFNDTVKFKDGHYEVCWPWKSTKAQLPSNFQLALGRLRSLTKRLLTVDESVRTEYNAVIENQAKLKIIERVPVEEQSSSDNLLHYLPHHPVVRIGHNTTKVRVVYDASAKCRKDQMSLNECMYRGPIILPDLCSVLIRFRLHRIAVIADIEKAFLQIALQPSERDVTRFLWFEDPKTLDTEKLVMYRFARVPFGVISSPFLLGATVQHHLKLVGGPTAEKIGNNIYVDNVITGVSSEDEAIEFYKEAKSIFQKATMNLREWGSNSNRLLEAIPPSDNCGGRNVKVLGLKWNSETDELQLQGEWDQRADCRTKREVMKAVASIYDPLGLFQPVTLRVRCFLRKLWNCKSSWDEEIAESLQAEWKSLHTDIAPLFNIKLPRRINATSVENETTLVVFSDASIDAYSTVVYLRSRLSENRWESTLVFAKSRLAPKEERKKVVEITLPRLELLGLAIGARAAAFVRKSLTRGDVKVIVLCDSTCVLGWLRSEKPQPTFVANRIKEIRKLENADFHHVSGEENPADIGTRGLTGHEIESAKFWWKGPEWLENDVKEWPTNSSVDVITATELQNIRENREPSVFHTFLVGEGLPSATAENHPFRIDPHKYSSFRKLQRVTVYCLKFAKRLWDKWSVEKRQSKPELDRLFENVSLEPTVTVDELRAVKNLWVKAIQRNHFADVISALKSRKHHQLVKQLNVAVDDDGLLRCFGRLEFAEIPTEAVRPKLLPKNDFVTNLIIKQAHEKLCHSGISHTLSQIRREFWIPHGRNTVRKIISRCILCRKHKGPPFALPKMPPWPRERVSRSAPFQFTGVDYLGPINVVVNGATQKMWVALFTCLAVRAVHLECVNDCTAQSFANCISRFIARRGAPHTMISDNAPQFRLSKTLFDRTWQSIFASDTLKSYIAERGIRWKFTTELAPWQGGVYERLVGIVKATFKPAVGRRLLCFEDFITLITEVEAIVNSRPLTYVYSDFGSGLALRPMDFLVGLPTGTPAVDPSIRPEGGDAGKNLLKHWKYKQKRLDLIWQQFYDEYLLSLRERGQTAHRGPRSQIQSSPQVDEVVLVKNADSPRGTWKLGKILKIIPSRDNAIRSVELILPNRQVIRRPLNLLYPLELPTVIEATDATETVQRQSDDLNETAGFDGFDDVEADVADQLFRMASGAVAETDRDDNAVALCLQARSCIYDGLCETAVMLQF